MRLSFKSRKPSLCVVESPYIGTNLYESLRLTISWLLGGGG